MIIRSLKFSQIHIYIKWGKLINRYVRSLSIFALNQKYLVLKATTYLYILSVLFYSCSTPSSTDKKTEADSLQYNPPPPGKIEEQEFRRFHNKLSSFFDSTLLKSGFNGGIVVAKNGVVLYEKYMGYINLQKRDSLTDSTSIHIASTSKTFTSIATLRLVQEKKLSLDDSLGKYFPRFPYPGITIKMLLSHRSGLPNYIYFMSNSNWDKNTFATNEDMLKVLYTDKPNKTFTPDSRFSYCNTNYVLLAMIIEKVTGLPFPEYMQQKFFGPLQMKHTYIFTLKDTTTATPSFNYNGNYWDFDFLDGTYGDKNVYSTPQDLLKWDQALYTDQIISAAMKDSAFAPHSFEHPSVHNYGLGWRLQLLPNGKKVIYHFGKWHGFNSAFARLTEEKATIIILGNKFNRSIYNSAHLCYDIFGDYLQQPGNDEGLADAPESPAKAGKHKIKKRR